MPRLKEAPPDHHWNGGAGWSSSSFGCLVTFVERMAAFLAANGAIVSVFVAGGGGS
jgi:hypothetical protein